MKKSINPEFELNTNRIQYLLDLYLMSYDELLLRLTSSNKTREKINMKFSQKKIDLRLLKKIDKIFGKGLNWYISNRILLKKTSNSIFFRKEKFNSALNFEAKKIVNQFEEKKFLIQSLSSYINFDVIRKVKRYSINQDARVVANEFKVLLNSIEKQFLEKKRIKKSMTDFQALKNYVQLLGELNIFVFEFIETWNKKEKANFNGFFMQPNLIVIQRQKYYRREIFTLFHELAHYLLNVEEIDEIFQEGYELNNKIERWCNDFAYSFLAMNTESKFDELELASVKNNYNAEVVEEIFKKTLLSKTAIYTKMRILNKISQRDYDSRVEYVNNLIRQDQLEKKLHQKREREFLKQQGLKAKSFRQKPIVPRLFKEIIKINYFEGNINEARTCKFLNIKPDKLEQELYAYA